MSLASFYKMKIRFVEFVLKCVRLYFKSLLLSSSVYRQKLTWRTEMRIYKHQRSLKSGRCRSELNQSISHQGAPPCVQ